MDVSTELKEKFYNLSGSTISEKKKNFNAFISELNSKLPQAVAKAALITDLHPRNKLEITFKVELLLHYELYENVLELLKSGNPLYISKILKNWNFFEKTFVNITGDILINDILPCTSYSTRMQLINRISKTLKNEVLANEFFEAIEEKYGIISADVLLTCCSMKMIKEKIEKYNLTLKHRQLMTILKRDKTFLDYYFDYLRRTSYLYSHNVQRPLNKIIKYDEELFFELVEKYDIKIRLGKRLSKKMLKNDKRLLYDAVNGRVQYSRRQIYQQLRKHPEIFNDFFLKHTDDVAERFCKNYLSTYTEIGKFVSYVSENRRYWFLNDFFKKKFNTFLHYKPLCVTEEVLHIMPAEIRKNVLDSKIKEDENLVYLYSGDISVPFVLDKIKHSSDINKRQSYLSALLKTCEFNKDDESLLKVLEYVEKRHRNDTDGLNSFFSRLIYWPNIENLSIQHWVYIDIIEKLLIIKDIHTDQNLILQKRIGHLLNNNLEISEHMQAYFDFLQNSWGDDIFTQIQKYRKFCILELKKYIDAVADDKLKARYLCFIFHYNLSTSSKDDIPILTYIHLLKPLLKDHFDRLAEIVKFYVRLYYSEFNPIIWDYKDKFLADESLFSWYLLHHETEILDKLKLVLDIAKVRNNKQFIHRLSLCAFRNIPQTLMEFCREENNSKIDQIGVVNILCEINQEEFMRIAKTYYPPIDGKINTDEPPERIKLQAAIIKNLSGVLDFTHGLRILLKFCVGDYLKYALQPLYTLATRVPEKVIIPFLKKLHKSAVSVRKHSIHLSKIVLPIDDFCILIKEQSVVEKNPSIKTILFKKALECAAVMPILKFRELLRATMHGIDKDDVEAHDLLLKIESIPCEYQAAYIPEAYTLFNQSVIREIRSKRFNLINNIPVQITDQLEYSLLETFLSEILFNDNIGWNGDNWVKLIFHAKGDKQVALLDFALRKFQDYHTSMNRHCSIDAKEVKFIKALCKNFLKFQPQYSMVHKCSTIWFTLLSQEADVSSYTYILFTLTYAECQFDLQRFAVKTKELIKKLLDGYNIYLFDTYASKFKAFLNDINPIDIIQFVEWLLSSPSDIPVYLLSIRLIAQTRPTYEKQTIKYKSIIRQLKQQTEFCIKVYLEQYISDLTEDEI